MNNLFKQQNEAVGAGRDVRRQGEPRPMGEVLAEYFRSDEPLARGYRTRLAVKANAEKGGTNHDDQ